MKIDVCITTDDHYVKYCATVMVSILENKADDDEPVFHIVHGGLKPENLEKLSKLGQVNLYKVDDSIFTPFSKKTQMVWPVTTLYRLKLASILDLDKVLYLDCDLIVNASLKPLFQEDIEGFAMAAVPDNGFARSMRRLNLSEENPEHFYCNAGVTLMNLKKFREDKIEEQLFDCLAKIWQEAIFGDQDVLNSVLYKNTKKLDRRYNYIPMMDAVNLPQDFDVSKEITIIHYAGMKPWETTLRCLLRDEFWKYYEKCTCITPEQFKKEYNHYKRWSTQLFQFFYLVKMYPFGIFNHRRKIYETVLLRR